MIRLVEFRLGNSYYTSSKSTNLDASPPIEAQMIPVAATSSYFHGRVLRSSNFLRSGPYFPCRFYSMNTGSYPASSKTAGPRTNTVPRDWRDESVPSHIFFDAYAA